MAIPFLKRSFVIVLLLATRFAFANPTPSLRVMIDPGHGGSDAGAVRGSAREADIALHVSHYLKEILSTDPRFTASMTRSSDIFVSLPERVKLADRSQVDLLLSVHANSSGSLRAKGVELYFQNHLPPDEDSLFLANTENMLMKGSTESAAEDSSKKNDVLSIIEDLKRNHRMAASLHLVKKISREWTGGKENIVVRQAPFYVVSKANVPSILIELGFITNPSDADKLVQPQYQKQIAQRIYKGLVEYKELMDKTTTSSLN